MEEKRTDTFDGRVYNPTKATLIATAKKTMKQVYGEDPDYDWTESLYKKPTGDYFVIGNGGKYTPFAADKNGERVSGTETIIWKKKNLEYATLWLHDNFPGREEEFLSVKTEERAKTVTFTMSEKALRNIKRKAKELGIANSTLIRRWAENLYDD